MINKTVSINTIAICDEMRLLLLTLVVVLARCVLPPRCVCAPGFDSTGLEKNNSTGNYKFGNCVGSACTCENGTSAQAGLSEFLCSLNRTNCVSCDPGYYFDKFSCIPYAGQCNDGTLIQQDKRTQENHCGSCVNGTLVNKACLIVTAPVNITELPKCDAGQGMNAIDNFKCKNCTAGTYQKQANESRFCVKQSQHACVAGEELKHVNNTKRDTSCEACKDGKFSNENGMNKCISHKKCDLSTEIVAQLPTRISDTVCAKFVNCSNETKQQSLFITVKDYVSGVTSWKCLDTQFTGSITNPIYLLANGTLDSATLGTFSITNVAIAGTAGVVTVAGGVAIVTGAGAASPIAAANAAAITSAAGLLAKKFSNTTGEQFFEALELEIGNKIGDNLSLKQRADTIKGAIKRVVPNATKNQIADAIVEADPKIMSMAAEKFKVIEAQKSGFQRKVAQTAVVDSIFGKPEEFKNGVKTTVGITKSKQKDLTKIIKAKAATLFLPQMDRSLLVLPRPSMKFRATRIDSGGIPYRRVNNKFNF